MLGVVGSGYIAALLPQEVVGRWLGADSGITGLTIVTEQTEALELMASLAA